MLPLRASNRLPQDVKKVVILGDGDFLAREVSQPKSLSINPGSRRKSNGCQVSACLNTRNFDKLELLSYTIVYGIFCVKKC